METNWKPTEDWWTPLRIHQSFLWLIFIACRSGDINWVTYVGII